MAGIEGENMRPVTWVVVEEAKGGDRGVGGTSLTAQDVKSMANGNARKEYGNDRCIRNVSLRKPVR